MPRPFLGQVYVSLELRFRNTDEFFDVVYAVLDMAGAFGSYFNIVFPNSVAVSALLFFGPAILKDFVVMSINFQIELRPVSRIRKLVPGKAF